jgi:hypothetical protein
VANSTVTGLVSVNVATSDNVGVVRVELRVNGVVVGIDSTAPFGFMWDSAGVSNGMASLSAVAFDGAGNSTASPTTTVNVANSIVLLPTDTAAPVVAIASPVAGIVSGRVTISTNASDNNGPAGIAQSLYIDGALHASGTGTTLAYSWNTRKVAPGPHLIEVRAKDAAGNVASSSVTVTR